MYILRTKQKSLGWAGHVACIGVDIGAYKVVVAKPKERRALERSMRRREDNIKMDLTDVGWKYGPDRSGSGQKQLAVSCENDNEPSGSIKCGEFFE
jgi:hypothetical protein